MSQDDLDHIPSIVPTRDTGSSAGARVAHGGKAGHRSAAPASGGSGLLARLFITVALVVAAVACAWAWQLQQQLQAAQGEMASYAARIGDLEARLSDTDEGMTQSAAVQAVKIAELEKEVRKLWDNVWKRSRERLSALEAASDKQGKSLAAMQASVAALESELEGASGDIAKLKSAAGDLSRLMASASANQAEVERVADTLNRIDLDMARLDKRIQGNEEWVGSVDAFRRQVNASLAELQATLRAMQAAP
jgi:chromosome segregation ATPase